MGKATVPFTALFWNIWVNSQLTTEKFHFLRDRFDTIIRVWQPDVLGLNEVMTDEHGESPLLKHLEAQGYHTFFAPFSPEKNGLFSGSAFASRIKPAEVMYHELGPDKYGAVRGFPGNTIKLIQARVPHGKQQVNVMVNYFAHLVPRNWATHAKHHTAFRKVMRMPGLQTATIIGGDFNQFKFMPRLWGAKSLYNRATGTLLHPTWKLVGKIPIAQANYDNIFWTKCGTILLDEFKVLERHPSDHTPLVARFTVR